MNYELNERYDENENEDEEKNEEYDEDEEDLSLLQRLYRFGARLVAEMRKFLKKLFFRSTLVDFKRETQRAIESPSELEVQTECTQRVLDGVAEIMKKYFHGQAPGEYLASLSFEERERTLTAFATELLHYYGLTDVTFRIAYLDRTSFGQYDPNTKTLTTNILLLQQEDPVFYTRTVMNILHESRHALQYAAVFDGHNPMGFNNATILTWANNILNYIKHSVDPDGYHNQPVEKDARAFAENIMHLYFQNIS